MENIVLVSDPNSDPDDLVAYLILKKLIKSEEISLKALIITLGNMQTRLKRARFAKGVFESLDLKDIPVGVGCDYTASDNERFINGNGYLEGNEIKAAAFEELGDNIIYDSQGLLYEVFDEAEDKSLTIVICADTVDIAEFIKNHRRLFLQKVKKLLIMGGVHFNKENDYLIPDKKSFNIAVCYQASSYIYRVLRHTSIPIYFVPRETVYECPFETCFYDSLKAFPSSVGKFLYDTRKDAMRYLIDMVRHNTFKTKDWEWFIKNFTKFDWEKDQDKIAYFQSDENSFEDMWQSGLKFYLYDPITVASMSSENLIDFIKVSKNREVYVAKINEVLMLRKYLTDTIYEMVG